MTVDQVLATYQDIVLEDSLLLTIELDDENGEPRNLTGYTGAMRIRASRDDPTSDLLATGTVTIDTDDGVVTVIIASTAAMTWVAGYYDVVITGTDSRPERIREGRAVLRQGVT